MTSAPTPPLLTISRATTEAEADVITSLVAEALSTDMPYQAETIHQYRDVLYNQAYFHKALTEKEKVLLVARSEDVMVGFALMILDFGGVLTLDWLAVDKRYRGQGIGSALLEYVDAWAVEHGYHYITLYTETAKNIAFYQARGYKHIGTHEQSWFGETEHVLAKNLGPYQFSALPTSDTP